MKLTEGVDPDLEAQADALIYAETRKTFKQHEKRDVLTPWKERDRTEREVLLSVVDPSVRQGMGHRVWVRDGGAAERSARDGIASFAPRRGQGRLDAWLEETGLAREMPERALRSAWGWPAVDDPPWQPDPLGAPQRRRERRANDLAHVPLLAFTTALALAGGEVRRLYVEGRDVVVRNRPW